MIFIKTPEEIEIMAEGGKILARVMAELEKKVKPGITTEELNRLAESLILKSNGQCSFKGYQGPDGELDKPYPACLCTSINEEIVHAIPSDRVLKQGDILKLDLGVFFNGFHTDMAITVPVGKVSLETQRLIDATKEALQRGIGKIKQGNFIGDVSRAIQKYAESQGFNVVRELCGHGIGRNIHEDPQILNSVSFDKKLVDKVKYADDGKIIIKQGMILCLEPMLTVGSWRIKESSDGFGFLTKDNSLSAHFEHTIAVIKDGAKILTVVE